MTTSRSAATRIRARTTGAFAALTALMLACSAALAQTAPPVRPARPAAAKPAPKPPAAPTLAAASKEQLAAAAMAHLGDYDCEFNETVHVAKNPRAEGYLDVRHRKSLWTMKPVLSSTGAVRLEDVLGHTLMLQIANKSMLMDVKIGQRLVDACVHEKQREAASRPPAQSLGILALDPAVIAAAAAASSAAAMTAAAGVAASAAATASTAAAVAASAAAAMAPARPRP